MYRRGILRASLLVERSCWEGRIRLGAGVLGSRIWVYDHTGDEVPGKPASGGAREFAVMRTTRLRLDHEACGIRSQPGAFRFPGGHVLLEEMFPYMFRDGSLVMYT